MKSVRFIIPLVVAVFCLTAVGYAESPAEFYKGKNIDFTLNDRPGGDAEMLARLMGPYMKEYMGATPIYTNMRKAGGSEGYVHVYRAKPDGLTMGVATLLPMILNPIRMLFSQAPIRV